MSQEESWLGVADAVVRAAPRPGNSSIPGQPAGAGPALYKVSSAAARSPELLELPAPLLRMGWQETVRKPYL